MRSLNLAGGLLRAVGVLLMALGLVHLAATPHIPAILNGSPPRVYGHAIGPTLLNHVLVGILLLPLGFTTWLAAAPTNRAEPWAKRVLLANALAVLALPVSVVMFMRRPEYYDSPLFLAGTLLVIIVSVLTFAAACLLIFKRPAIQGRD